jgi:MFS family permease
MIGFFAAFGEGLAINWSVLHLRDLGASAFVGGAGFAIFNTVMFIGRMTNNAVVARFGVVQSVVFSAIAITIAGVVIAFTSNLWLAVIAMGVLGFGVAGPIPTTLTAGAQLVPGQNSALSGALMSMCYVSFIVGPPLIGIVAERTTLQQALIATIVVGICLFVFARRLATITQRATISPPNA